MDGGSGTSELWNSGRNTSSEMIVRSCFRARATISSRLSRKSTAPVGLQGFLSAAQYESATGGTCVDIFVCVCVYACVDVRLSQGQTSVFFFFQLT